MTSLPVPEPLKGFKRLGSASYLYVPPSYRSHHSAPQSSSTPDLILLCSWLDAAPKHIAKYTTGYQTLYPSSRILLVTTSFADMFFSSASSSVARIAPVVDVLLSLASTTSSRSGTAAPLLLALFSNGGATTAVSIARAYHARTGGQPLPLRCMIADSAPGKYHPRRTHAAMMHSMPKGWLMRWVGTVAVYVYLFMYSMLMRLRGRVEWHLGLRRNLLDEGLFGPGGKEGARRGYLYSEEDEMVDWRDVLEHAVEARGKGYEVREEEFKGSAHCAHGAKEPERYWRVVDECWRDGQS